MKGGKFIFSTAVLFIATAVLTSCDQLTDFVGAHEHTYATEWTYDSNCHWHESTCGHDVVSGKAAHSWNDGEITTPATEEAEGVKTYSCTVCEATKTEAVEKLPHTHAFESAWTSDSTSHWHAASCGHEVTSGNAEHTWDSGVVATEATEEAEGVKTYTCTVCKATKTEAIEKLAHTHRYSDEWTSDSTSHWHAATCGHEVTSDKAEHTWNDGVITTPATEEAEGVKTYICTVCGATKTEAIEKLAHTHRYSDEWTSDSSSHWHAASCGHEVTSDKAEHTWNNGVITTEANCTTNGVKTYTCFVCGATKTEEIAATGHSYSSSWTSDSTSHWHAASCGHEVTSDKAAHTWDSGVVTTPATIYAEGVKTYTCTVCGETKTEAIQKLTSYTVFATVSIAANSDISVTSSTSGNTVTLTADEGYDSYEWTSINKVLSTSSELVISNYAAGTYVFNLVAVKNSDYYSACVTVVISSNN